MARGIDPKMENAPPVFNPVFVAAEEEKKKKKRKVKGKKEDARKARKEREGGRKVEQDEYSDDEVEDYGSPWDRTEQTHLRIEDLDLDKSYIDEAVLLQERSKEQDRGKNLPEKRPRWKHEGPEPLTDVARLAEMQWDPREPDLHRNDIDGQINRCKERIEDNIMPEIFEKRLADYEAQRDDLLDLQNEEDKGISWPALHRIDALAILEIALQGGDTKNQLPNVRAILSAYRNKTLLWTNGLVTYWSKGKQISQPRPFVWDEFDAINSAHQGHDGFWVEGFISPTPTYAQPSLSVQCAHPRAEMLHYYQIALRIPGRTWWTELDFKWDTGASDMYIYREDLDEIAGPVREPIPVIAQEEILTAGGRLIFVHVISLEITVLDRRGRRMCPWIRIDARVDDQSPFDRQNHRLDGGALRNLFYSLMSPDNELNLKIADKRRGLFPIPRAPDLESRLARAARVQHPPNLTQVKYPLLSLPFLTADQARVYDDRQKDNPPPGY